MKKTGLLIFVLCITLAFAGCATTEGLKEDGEMVKDKTEKAIDDLTEETGLFSGEEFKVEDEMPCVSDYSGFENKCYGFGFRKDIKGKIPSVGIYENFLKGNNAVYVGDADKKIIYLTFDEGYENGYTEKILDVLKDKHVPAAFFCTGDYLVKNEKIVKRMIDEGHIVGNHTWNHKSMPKVTDDEEFREELKKIDDYLYDKYKIKTKYFRYPNGEFSEKSLKMVKDMGYKTVFWSLAYKDWERGVKKGASTAVKEVTDHIHNGAIILLHAVSEDNMEALAQIIDSLTAEGYTFSNLDNLKL